jgi:curli biogenesis system outer membrane secretion channel CsgG
MKPTILIILALLAIPVQAQKTLGDGIKDLATQITASAAKQEKQKIAVLPFHELDGQPTVLGTYLAEELVTNLFQLGNFKIVERQLLDKVMGELKVEQSGAIDPKTAKEIGRIAAVDAIVTGSITDLESFVAVNCRLIDTTTGEVFGAAQTKITKDEDVNKIMRTTLTSGGASGGTGTSYQAAKGIATKDIGSLRVVLKSVLPLKLRAENGQTLNGIRCSFEFINLDAHVPLAVAANAEPERRPGLFATGGGTTLGTAPGDLLRTTLVDDRGTVWRLYASGASNVTGLGVVSPGQNEKGQAFSTTEIAALLDRKDATDMSSIKDRWGDDKAFVWGSTTPVPPGGSVSVVMNFVEDKVEAILGASPTFFQFNGEIVVGIARTGGNKSYSLQNLTFDRVSLPAKK